MSNDLSTITSDQLKRAIVIKEQIEALTSELDHLLDSPSAVIAHPTPKRRKMSAAGRAAIRAAQKARWAKVKGGKKAAPKRKRKMSAAGRARISAAAKARWKAAKAAGKTRL